MERSGKARSQSSSTSEDTNLLNIKIVIISKLGNEEVISFFSVLLYLHTKRTLGLKSHIKFHREKK